MITLLFSIIYESTLNKNKMTTTAQFMSKDQLLNHWQGHRNLTRRVINAFPEKDLLEFSIGGMRPFSKLSAEMINIASPSLKSFVKNIVEDYHEDGYDPKTKQELLDRWDEETVLIHDYFQELSEERLQESFNLFGSYEAPIYQNILYFIDNEIHHRAQGYVYLRALGIEPPFFYER